MKRKLSALLSLVLAVVMVFPTAIGATSTGAEPLAPVTLSISSAKREDNTAVTPTGTIRIPVGATVTVAFTTDGVLKDYTVKNQTNRAVDVKKSGNTYTFTGIYANESCELTFQAEATNKATEQDPAKIKADSTPITLKFQCIDPEIIANEVDFISAKYEYRGNLGSDSDAPTYGESSNKGTVTPPLRLDASMVLSCIDIEVPLTNSDSLTVTRNSSTGAYESTTEISNIRVAVANNSTPPAADAFDETVLIRGGNQYLFVKYDAVYTYHNYTKLYKDQIHVEPIYVSAKEITSISVTDVPYKHFLYSDTGVEKDDLIVTANYKDGSTDDLEEYILHGIYNASNKSEAIRKAQTGATNADDFTDLLTSLDEKIWVVVEYDGFFDAMNAGEELDFSNPIPYRVEVADLLASAKTDYVDGQIFGEYGFNGVVLHVYYEGMGDDGVEQSAKISADSYIEYIHDNGIPNQSKPGINDLRGTLEFEPFVYGDGKVDFTYTENNTVVEGVFNFRDSSYTNKITVAKKQVESLEIANKAGVKVDYQAGDKLNLDGLTLKVTYNNDKIDEISYANPACTHNPKHGDALTEDIDSVLFVYTYTDAENKKQSVSCELPITVSPKQVVTPGKTVTTVLLTESYNAKKDYFLGEHFQPAGYSFTIVYNDGSTKQADLEDCYNIKVNNTRYYDNSTREFTRAMSGALNVSFTLTSASSPVFELVIPDITAKARPVLESIAVTSPKTNYMEGETPRVCDFKIIAKYDDGSTRVFEVDEKTTGATKATYSVTESSVTYKVTITPTSVAADTKSLRITYSERVNNKTTNATYDYEVTVTVPDAIVQYYDTEDRGYTTKAYEDFYEALEFAEDIMDSYSSSYANRVPEIELRRDVTMLSDFTTTETIDIDLNGHNITMIRGDISVSSRAATGTRVTITNTDRTEAKLIYSNDDEDSVLIAYNDTYVIDEDSTGAGKYEIVISSVKNGKVTGPDEVTHGHDAQFTITPDEGYEIGSVKVNNRTVSIPKEGEKLTIKDIQAKQTVTVTFKEKAWDNPFTDVYKSATYYKSIQFVYENELFQGTSATKFEPDTTMTRAMFVTVLGRLAKVDTSNYNDMPFTDVKHSAATSWYVPYVEWAASVGLVEGYGNGKFGPDDPITHAQMYVLMQRYALLVERMSTNAATSHIPANDADDVPDWAIDAVRYAAKEDILVLSSNRLTPNSNAKRSELAVLLDKFCNNVLDWEK